MFLVQLQCPDCDEEEILSLHIVNGALPSVPVGNFLQNATSEELGFAENISTIDIIVLDITVSDSCSISLSVCVNVSVQEQSSNVTHPQFDPSVLSVIISENTPMQSDHSSQWHFSSGRFLQLFRWYIPCISFVLCANMMYGNNLTSNKPVEKL